MTNLEVKTELQIIFKEIFNFKSDLVETMTAQDVRGWDSLNHIRLMVRIQRKLKIHLTTSELTEFKNIGELIALIARKKIK